MRTGLTETTEPAVARGRVLVYSVAAALFGAGVAATWTTMSGYFYRYSQYDGLIGEVDDATYAGLTNMYPVERGSLLIGALLVAAGIALAATIAIATAVRRRRQRGRKD